MAENNIINMYFKDTGSFREDENVPDKMKQRVSEICDNAVAMKLQGFLVLEVDQDGEMILCYGGDDLHRGIMPEVAKAVHSIYQAVSSQVLRAIDNQHGGLKQ